MLMTATPRQRLWQERVEGLLGLAAPLLDFVLAAGDRVSRLAAEDQDYYPVRAAGEAAEIEPAAARARAAGSGD
jgi:hypothetical protein